MPGLSSVTPAARELIMSTRPDSLMKIRDVLIEDGGATFLHYTMGGMNFSTNHQVVFVPQTRILWMKTAEQPWQEVNLSSLFS